MRTRVWMVAAVAVAGGALYGSGCGDDEKQTIFSGNVSSVQPTTAAAPGTRESGFAFRLPQISARAFAQGTCAAPGGATLLFCLRTSTFEVCQPVEDADCTFTLITGLEIDRAPAVLRFVSDTDENGSPDSGEPASTVAQSLIYCNEDVVSIANAAVNFATGVTLATVRKTVDRCTAAPTGTPRPSGTGTPTRTPTGTLTPSGTTSPSPTGTSYVAAAPLNEPPTSLLAFLFSAGAVGLLIPRRRRLRGSE